MILGCVIKYVCGVCNKKAFLFASSMLTYTSLPLNSSVLGLIAQMPLNVTVCGLHNAKAAMENKYDRRCAVDDFSDRVEFCRFNLVAIIFIRYHKIQVCVLSTKLHIHSPVNVVSQST